MTTSRRTALAFVAAPLVALLELAIVSASTRPADDGLSWLSSFLSWLVLAAFQVYAVVLFFGAIVFAILSSTKKESRFAYTISGLVTGILFASLLLSLGSSGSKAKAGLFVSILAAIGASTGISFGALHLKKNA